MKENKNKEVPTLQDYYRSKHELGLAKASKVLTVLLTVYMVVSVVIFRPMFIGSGFGGWTYQDPLKFFLNFCFPIGFFVFLWSTKLAINNKEWRRLSLNLIIFVVSLLFALKYYWFLQTINAEFLPDYIWWLRPLL